MGITGNNVMKEQNNNQSNMIVLITSEKAFSLAGAIWLVFVVVIVSGYLVDIKPIVAISVFILSALVLILWARQLFKRKINNFLSQQQHELNNHINKSDYVDVIEALEDTVVRMTELSSGQINESREQLEEAITSLTNRFADLVERIKAATRASEASVGVKDCDGSDVTTDCGLLVNIFDNSRKQLNKLVEQMESSVKSKHEMLNKMGELSTSVSDLKSMAQSVGKIASQTNLLALNAAIEAARAGEMGRGFAVVADEVRALSKQSGETGDNISKMVSNITETMSETLKTAERSVREEMKTGDEAGEIVKEVMSCFEELTNNLSESSEILKKENVGIQEEVADILFSLQFQDRVSQILTHVSTSLESFSSVVIESKDIRVVNGELRAINKDGVNDMLMQGYTTNEQRRLHGNSQGCKESDSEIEFF